jgi:hypothetical protein
MQWRAFKPCLIAWYGVKINDGGKAAGEIGAGNLGTISSPKFWMALDRVVTQSCGAPHMNM